MPQTIRAEKADGKNEVICVVSIFPFKVTVFKLSKKVQYLQFCADLSKKSKYIKVIYIYASERARCALSENSIVYYAMICCFRDIRVWSQRGLLNFCWVGIFSHILIANISWTVSQTFMNHTIFYNSVMRTFRYIYGNCFQRFEFLAVVSTKLHEMHLLDNLRTIT